MTWFTVAQSALMLGLAVLIVVFIVALLQSIKTLTNLGVLIRNLNEQVLPLADEIKNLLNGVNTKLARVEDIATSVREVSDKIQATSQVAKMVMSAPVTRVTGWAGAAKLLLQGLSGGKKK